VNTLMRSLLPVAVAATLAACGGGGGYGGGGDGNNNPPRVTLADGQFVLERFDGLGVSSTGANDATPRAPAFATTEAGVVKSTMGGKRRNVVVGAAVVVVVMSSPFVVCQRVAPATAASARIASIWPTTSCAKTS